MSVQRFARWLLVPMIAAGLQAQSRLDTTAGNEGSLKSPTTAPSCREERSRLASHRAG